MNKHANGSDAEQVRRRTGPALAPNQTLEVGDSVTMEVTIPSANGGVDGGERTMRIQVPRGHESDPEMIRRAVAEGLMAQNASAPAGEVLEGIPQQVVLGGQRAVASNGDRGGYPPSRSLGSGEYPEEEFVPEEAPTIGRELSLRDIFFMVRERWILGLSVGLLLAGGLAYWMMSKPPVFESEAELLVDFKEQAILPIQALEQDGSTRTTLEQVMEVHVRSLQSPAFRGFVAAALARDDMGLLRGFRNHAAFKEAYTDGLIQRRLRGKEATPEALAKLPEPEELFREHFYLQEDGPLKVSTGKRSQFVRLAFRHPDPLVARQVAHAYVSSYNAFLGGKEKDTHEDARVFLQSEVSALEKEIGEKEREVSRYRQRHKIVETEEGEGSRADDRVENLDQQVTASQVELNGLEIQLERIEQVDARDVVRLSQFPVIAENTMVAAAKEKVDLNQEERTQLEVRYLERHPKIIQNVAARKTLVQQLGQEVTAAVEDFRNRVVQKREEHRKLLDQLQTAEEATLGDNDPIVNYRVMVGKLDILKKKHETLLDRLSETQIAERLDRTNVDVMTPAIMPEFPVDPDPRKILALAGLLLLGGLFGLPVGLGFLDTRLKSFSEAEAFLGIECLGCIAERPKLSHMELGQCVLAERDEQVTEGFRVVYGSVELHSDVGFPKVFVTSSTGPGEGKSFITANLASTFARHGKRVLIVDCDLRKPSQHKLIGAKNDAGLLRWFKGGGHVPSTAKELVDNPALGFVPLSEEYDIFLLRAGGSTRNPSEVITSRTFEDLLQSLRNWFDVIMLDSPPVGLFPDAMFLANYAEEALFVCKHNGINRHKIKFALKKLQGGNAKVLGTVMNQLSASRRHQYGYGYKDYGYGSYSYKDYAKYYHDKEED